MTSLPPDNNRPFILSYAPPEPKPPNHGGLGHFARAAFATSFVLTVGEGILAAKGGADPAMVVCCLTQVLGLIVAGVGFAVAAATVATRHLLLERTAEMRGLHACTAAGVLYPAAVIGSVHLIAILNVPPVGFAVGFAMLSLIVVGLAIAAGWWMVRRKPV